MLRDVYCLGIRKLRKQVIENIPQTIILDVVMNQLYFMLGQDFAELSDHRGDLSLTAGFTQRG